MRTNVENLGGWKSPAVVRGRHTEVALKGHRLYRLIATAIILASSLSLLSGCGGLKAGQSSSGTVGFGNASLDFGQVIVGNSKTMSDTITNSSSSTITVNSIQGVGSGFQISGVKFPLLLVAGETVSFSVQFTPTAAGNPSVTVNFQDPNSQTLANLAATGKAVTIGQLSPNPAQISFGNIKVGSNQTSSVVLSNSGGIDLDVTQATLSGAGFSMSNLSLPLTLHAGGTTSVTITFAPTGSGAFSGSVTFATTSNSQPSTVVLKFQGDGVSQGTLAANPASLAFGSVQVGHNGTLAETLTNTGGSAVTISQATASGAGFSVSGLSLPATVNPNQSVSFNVDLCSDSCRRGQRKSQHRLRRVQLAAQHSTLRDRSGGGHAYGNPEQR